jgi:hypothetical protein
LAQPATLPALGLALIVFSFRGQVRASKSTAVRADQIHRERWKSVYVNLRGQEKCDVARS